MNNKDYLLELAKQLDSAHRCGNEIDNPEGMQWVQISDVLARDISKRLREIAGVMSQHIEIPDDIVTVTFPSEWSEDVIMRALRQK